MSANDDNTAALIEKITDAQDDCQLLEMVLANFFRKEDMEHVRKALLFAYNAHRHQTRANGEPYIVHPISVAEILGEMQLDVKTICAGLLHDVLEDTDCTEVELREQFGDEIADLVLGVTKVGEISAAYRSEVELENLRRMLVAMAKDPRVIVIKLADRLHNLRTLQFLPRNKQLRIAQDTLKIYTPLAHRLGIGRLKWELEDYCFMFLNPEMYQNIKQKVSLKRKERELFIRQACKELQEDLFKKGINAVVEGRAKHFYSIYTKMLRDNKTFEEIYDLIALRVICETVGDCYAVLGEVHTMWRQVEGRFKDFISNPKANNYRSIHTTVLGPHGRMMEIQIRTQEMHFIAEHGIASHWRYKSTEKRSLRQDAIWLQMFSKEIMDTKNPEEFFETIQSELFSDEVYVYTPKGDVLRLPKDASPLDYAFKVHTELGLSCVGAKVNGRLVALNYKLNTGDVVEILTSPHAKPSRAWLDIVKTSSARNKIRRALLESQRDELLRMGQSSLMREIQRAGFNAREFFNSDDSKKIAEELGQKTLDDLFVNIGYGRISTKQVIARLLKKTKPALGDRPPDKKEEEETPSPKSSIVKLADIDEIMYRIARCCNPIPGDEIIGFVTRGRGVSIHKSTCKSIQQFKSDPGRILPLFWEGDKQEPVSVGIEIKARDRKNLLSDVSQMISSTGTNIIKCHSVTDKEIATFLFTVEVINTNHLNTIMQQLLGINGVKNVRRVRTDNRNGAIKKGHATMKQTTKTDSSKKKKSTQK